MSKKYARGGVIPSTKGQCPTSDDLSFVLSRGCVVVPDSQLAEYGRGFLEALNGGNSDVVSVSEALAEIDEDA